MTTPHTHADIYRALADGKAIQSNDAINRGNLVSLDEKTVLSFLMQGSVSDLRIKPDTVTLTMEIPAPMKERPADGQEYWYLGSIGISSASWSATANDEKSFARGIWPTEEAACAADAARVEAMAKIRGGV